MRLNRWHSPYISIVASLFFFYVVYATLTGNETCGKNPWNFDNEKTSTTLEWMVPSPPGYHTFEEIPAVKELPDDETLAKQGAVSA